MSQLVRISDTEWLVMRTLWEKSPLTANDIVSEVQKKKEINHRTIKTLIRRLIAKKAVDYTVDEQDSRVYHYFAIVEQNDCVETKNKTFLNLYYENNVREMFVNFLSNHQLTNEEIDQLKQVLDDKKTKE